MAQVRSASFVVRLRVHPATPDRWWGEAHRVETGERIAFSDQDKLLAFLQRHLRELSRPAPRKRGR